MGSGYLSPVKNGIFIIELCEQSFMILSMLRPSFSHCAQEFSRNPQKVFRFLVLKTVLMCAR